MKVQKTWVIFLIAILSAHFDSSEAVTQSNLHRFILKAQYLIGKLFYWATTDPLCVSRSNADRKKVCENIFKDENIKKSLQVEYDETGAADEESFKCQITPLDCILGLKQNMMKCPLKSTDGKTAPKYYLSWTNFGGPDSVLLFEALNGDKVTLKTGFDDIENKISKPNNNK